MELSVWIWFGLVIAFLIAEVACPIHLISIWFVAGSLAAMLAAWLHWAVWIQVVLFVLVSGSLLALLWPLTRKHLNPHVTPTNVDAIVGTAALVTASIDNLTAAGQVKLNGMEWTARSTSGDPIEAGTRVTVDRIEGVKVFVSPVKEKICADNRV